MKIHYWLLPAAALIVNGSFFAQHNAPDTPVLQSVRAGSLHRRHIARWEAQEKDGRARLLDWAVGESEMPIVLVATPKA